MRAVYAAFFVWIASLSFLHAQRQQLVPVIREIRTSSASSLSQWNAFVRIAEYGGCHYVALAQVAALLNGSLRWHAASNSVELSVRGNRVRFYANSTNAIAGGRVARLERLTVKNEDGFWIPASFFASNRFFNVTGAKLAWPPEEKRRSGTPNGEAGSEKREAGSERRRPDVPRSPLPASRSAVRDVPASRSPLPASPSPFRAIRRIVIDPGHGGKDPGAIGPRGAEEKKINLLVAQELAEVLRAKDYEVLLTRTDDSFLPLEERAKIANKHRADLFISIHCNASLSPKLKGFEVYFLSETASSPQAAAVARMENAPLALEGKALPTQSQLERVLRSLVKNAHINEASLLGTRVDRHMAKALSAPSLGVKQAAFYVLRGAAMPAILIESGFLSNPREERLLGREAYRRKLAQGIAAAIADHDQWKTRTR